MTNETQEVVTEEVIEEIPEEETTEETTETTEEKPKDEKPTETLEQKRARLARELSRTEKKLGIKKETPDAKAKAGGLDENALDYLDVKGITEDEDISVIETVMERTGMTARQALKDEYVQSKLKANQDAREVKNAMPSSNKRGDGQQSVSLDAAIAAFEKDGRLPEDFETRTKVVNAIASRSGSNKPVWQR